MKKSLCYKFLIFSLFIFSTAIISCKNTSETKLVYTESDTIKKSVKEKEKDITWTQEIEPKRLTEKITRSSMKLGSDVAYTKDLFKISNTNKAPVYPELSDFGSLDTRNLKSSVKDKLNHFCKSLSTENHSGADSYFSRKYIFNYVFFVNELESEWKNNFGKEYPSVVKEDKASSKSKDKKEEKTDESGIFTKWTFGEPFVGSEIMQIPVRFYATCGIIDITVYLNSSGNNEIYQITIDRWKKV